MRCLIVDDSRAVQGIVRRAIQKSGIANLEFESASDGQQALSVLKDWPADILLTDWHMPGMTGLELLKRIRKEFSAKLKVGFISTESAPENIDAAHRLGAAFFIRKPFQEAELIECLLQVAREDVPPALAESGTETAAASPAAAPVSVQVLDVDKVTSGAWAVLKRKLTLSLLNSAEVGDIAFPSSVSLYSLADSTEVRGLCLIDGQGLAILEEVLGKRVSGEVGVSAAFAASLPPEIIQLLTIDVAALFKSSDGRPMAITKTQLLQKEMPQLREIMRRSPYRRDYNLVRSGQPAGRLVLISK